MGESKGSAWRLQGGERRRRSRMKEAKGLERESVRAEGVPPGPLAEAWWRLVAVG